MSPPALHKAPGALLLIERAIHLLRRNGAVALAEYFVGSLPFTMALLYFWSDMSRNPMAAWYCAPSAAGLALLFIWMKLWQVRFCRRLWCELQGIPPEPWPLRRSISTAARQAVLHATGVVALPIAAIIAFPLGWVYAFYQNLSVLEDPPDSDLGTMSRVAKSQAALWPGQNHVLLSIMTVFGLFVFLNLGIGLVALPYLIKGVFGTETTFTLSGMHLFNTTFFAVVGALTYLCVDPIIKAAYVLRCFYGRSRRTGDDLRAALKPFLKVMILLLVFLVLPVAAALAQDQPAAPMDPWETVSDSQAFVGRLDHAIEETLQQRRFAWRLPREVVPEPSEEQGWLMRTFQWIVDSLKDLLRPVGRWLEAFLDWLKKLIPEPESSRPSGSADWGQLTRLIFYILGVGLALVLLYWLVRWFRHRRPAPKAEPDSADPAVVDLADENVTADDLPLDRWLSLAKELMAQQDYRRALRALYLSVLALLADHQRVVIARYKSNSDYRRELARRAHAEPELLSDFVWCIQAFERAWYGMHPVVRAQLEQFIDHQERIATLVQQPT